jgi:hypothetical protein
VLLCDRLSTASGRLIAELPDYVRRAGSRGW